MMSDIVVSSVDSKFSKRINKKSAAYASDDDEELDLAEEPSESFFAAD